MKLIAACLICDIRTEIHPVFEKEEVGEINEDVEAPVKQQLLEEGGKWVDSILLAIDGDIPDDASFNIVKVSHTTCLLFPTAISGIKNYRNGTAPSSSILYDGGMDFLHI